MASIISVTGIMLIFVGFLFVGNIMSLSFVPCPQTKAYNGTCLWPPGASFISSTTSHSSSNSTTTGGNPPAPLFNNQFFGFAIILLGIFLVNVGNRRRG